LGVGNFMWINLKKVTLGYLRQHDRGLVLALLALALVVYAPFLGNPFVFDDLPFMSRAVSYYTNAPFHFDLRWFSYVTLGWTWAFFVDSPYAYRLGNIFLHALNGILLFYFLRQLLMSYVVLGNDAKRGVTNGAWIGATFFVCHPVAVYATGYMVQRSILMATFFMLVMLVAYVRGVVSGRKGWLVLAVGAYFLAFFSKEHSVMAPAIAVMLSTLLSPRILVSKSAQWMTWVAFAAVGTFGLLHIKGLIGVPYETAFEIAGADSYFLQSGLSGVQPSLLQLLSVLTQAGLFFKYLLLWWLPNPAWMSVDMRVHFVDSILDQQAWAAMVAFVAYGVLGASLLFRRGKLGLVGFALLFPWLMFLVEFSSVRVQEPFVLYRSYLWLPGMALLISLLLTRFPSQRMMVAMTIVMLGLIPLAWNRLWTFSDPYHLWNDAALMLEDGNVVGADRIYYNRGNAALSSRNWDMAIEDYRRVVANNPKIQPAYLNLGAAYYGLKRYQDALNAYDQAIALNPKDAQAYLGKGLSFQRMHNETAALEQINISCGMGSVVGCAIAASTSHAETPNGGN